ncbi:MAG TPA: sigma-70 family RNA polymerase sigma factor [Polyangia bacterium]
MTPLRDGAKSALHSLRESPRVYPTVIDPLDSGELIRRAQAGDVRAFEALVVAHIPRLRRFARSFAKSDADADDLAQEALIKVYRSLRGYRFESSFSTWLYRVTKNCFMDAQRSTATRERTVAAVFEGVGEAAEALATAPDILLLKAEERARLWTAIAGISVDFRTVLVLSDVEGFGIGEVAAIEKLPEGTVKSRLHRGRAQLARLLLENEPAGNQAGPTSVPPERKTLDTSFPSPADTSQANASNEGMDVP